MTLERTAGIYHYPFYTRQYRPRLPYIDELAMQRESGAIVGGSSFVEIGEEAEMLPFAVGPDLGLPFLALAMLKDAFNA
jgi:hypothetical protein